MAKTDVFFRKTLTGTFGPSDEFSADWASGVKVGQIVKSSGMTFPRNYQFHCKYWVLMGQIFKTQTRYATMGDLEFAFRMFIGHGYWIDTPRGEQFRPHSISFARMSEAEFQSFYDRAIQFVVEEVIPRTNSDDVRANLLEFAA